MPSSRRKPSKTKTVVVGEVVSSVDGFVLVRTARRLATQAPVSSQAATLLPKLAQALSRPGISRDVVFKGAKRGVYSYSIDPTDTTRIVRESADGKRTLGRLVGERFVPVKAGQKRR